MDSEVNGNSQNSQSSGANRSLISSMDVEGSRTATENLSMTSGSSGSRLEQLNTGNNSSDPILPADSEKQGLSHRHRHGDGPRNRYLDSRASNGTDEADVASIDTDFSEITIVPKRNFGFIQITSLMLNSTIGAGPFVTPGYVLALTGSKPIALGLVAFGGVYTALSMLVFLEFGTALPYNGGALIYLDEVFHRPRLLATVLFSVFFILKAGTYSASKNVAQYTLAVANPDTPLSEISDGLVRFTAVVVQTMACLLLYFLQRLCFVFNSTLALYKIVFLLTIFVAGMASIRGPSSGLSDFNEKHIGFKSSDALSAMLAIISSYVGWDGANYVAGEIKDVKNTLRWAAIATVSLLTVLQLLTTFAYYAVFDYATLTSDHGQKNIALVFARKVFGPVRGMEIAIGISMFAQLLFSTYVVVKVKQAIAWQRIIPFYRFFGREDAQFHSPGGALVLHWIFTCLTLMIFRTQTSARSFYTGIYNYGYATTNLFLGIGLLRLRSRMCQANPNWKPTYLKNQIYTLLISFIYVSMNVIILVMTAIPTGSGIPGYYWTVTIIGFMAFGVFYWGVIRLLGIKSPGPSGRRTLGSRLGLEIRIWEDGDDVPDQMKPYMDLAKADGSKRRLDYTISGPMKTFENWWMRAKEFIFKHIGY